MTAERSRTILILRPLTPADLAVITPWFEDPDTRRFLGGSQWPAAMLAHDDRAVKTTFRGARQTCARHYLALADDAPVGYIDCGVFDCCTVYGGDGDTGPIITETIEAITGSIAFAVDPNRRREGIATSMIRALTQHPDLAHVELFEAGVDPENVGSRRALTAAGFDLPDPGPDCEGMLYYRAWRTRPPSSSTPR
jgi:RimJ/RimL family protein N-acetyltransferase